MLSTFRCLTLITLFNLFLWNTSFSQKREDLIGDWKIMKVELLPNAEPEVKQGIGFLTPIFLKSVFHFKENNACSFSCPDPDMDIKEAAWQYDFSKKSIQIKSKGKPGVLMEITVREQNGKYLFFLAESPIILTVVKKEK